MTSDRLILLVNHRHLLRVTVTVVFGAGLWSGAPNANSAETSAVALGAATFDELSAEFALVEAQAKVSPYVTLASGVGYLRVEPDYRETQLRATATAHATLGRFSVEDRNLLYVSSESVRRYRNRLRLTMPAPGRYSSLSFRAYDELYVDLDRGGVIRNNLALGFAAAVSSRCRAELYHVWSDNRTEPDIHYLLVIVSVTLNR